MKSSICKRILSLCQVVTIVLSLCTSALVGLNLGYSDQRTVYAAEGDTDYTPTGGYGGGSAPSSGDLSVSTTSSPATGCRIYLAKSSVIDSSTKNFSNTSVKALDSKKQYAIYEMARGTEHGSPKYWIGNGQLGTILDSQICHTNSTTWNFEALCKGTSPGVSDVHCWKGGSETYLDDLADWANKHFGAGFKDSDLPIFLSNYRNKLGASIYDAAGLPKTLAEFSEGNWVLVIEPVVLYWVSGSSGTYACSYNEMYHPQSGKLTSHCSSGDNYCPSYASSTSEPYGKYSFFEVMYHKSNIAKDVSDDPIRQACNILKGFHSDFDCSISGSHVNNFKFGISGFGIYLTEERFRVQPVEMKIAKHLSVYASTSSSGSYGYAVDLKNGQGCNSGAGQIAVADKNASSNYSAAGSGSNLSYCSAVTTNYWQTPLSNTYIYGYGAVIKGLNCSNATSTKGGLHKLVGSSETNFDTLVTNNSSKYILQEVTLATMSIKGERNLTNYNTSGESAGSVITGLKIPTSHNWSIEMSQCAIAIDDSSKDNPLYDRTVGSNFTSVLKDSSGTTHLSNLMAKRVTAASSDTVTYTESYNSYNDLFSNNAQAISKTGVTNAYGNLCTAALKKSSITGFAKGKATVDGSSIDIYKMGTSDTSKSYNTNTIGLAFDYFIEDRTVQSAFGKICRESSGRLTTQRNTSFTEYSIFNGSKRVISNHSASTSSTTQEFVVVFPNTQDSTNKKYSVFNDSGVANMRDLVFSSESLDYNTFKGMERLVNKVSSIKGVEVIPIGTDESFNLTVGAYLNSDKKSYTGYSVYIISDAIVHEPVDVSVGSGLVLEEYQANYVYPTVLGTSSGTLIKTVSTGDLDSNMSFSGFTIAKKSPYQGMLSVFESTYSNKFSLLYATTGGQNFAAEATSNKYFSSAGTNGVILNHQVNLSRGTFIPKSNSNSLVVSIFNPDNKISFSSTDLSATSGFVKTGLGLNAGVTPVDHSLLSAAGRVSSGTGTQQFKWGCNKLITVTVEEKRVVEYADGHLATETYTYTYDVNPFINGEDAENLGYDLDLQAYRYIPQQRVAASSESAMIASSLVKANGASFKGIFTQSYTADELKFYPEVKMSMWQYDNSNSQITMTSEGCSVTRKDIWVLGDRVRTLTPRGMYILRVSMNSPASGYKLSGKIKSDDIATGSAAKKLSKSMGNLPVVFSGGNISLSVTPEFKLNVSGFVLDLMDKNLDAATYSIDTEHSHGYGEEVVNNVNLKVSWGDEGYSAEQNYVNWIKNVKSNIRTDVSLTTYNNGSVKKVYNGWRSSCKVTGGDIVEKHSYQLIVRDGALDKSTQAYTNLITAIADEYKCTFEQAEGCFNSSNIAKVILNAVESNTSSDNTSMSALGKTHWYDEKVRTFVVRYYKCKPIMLDNVLVADKIDINAGPSQDVSAGLFKKGYLGKWNMTVYLQAVDDSWNVSGGTPKIFKPSQGSSSLIAADNSGTIILYKEKINGADFIISDATTADAKH